MARDFNGLNTSSTMMAGRSDPDAGGLGQRGRAARAAAPGRPGGQRPRIGSGAGGAGGENRRLELRFGYGFSAIGDRFTSTPELGLGLSNGHREYTLGWRFGLVAGGTNALEVRVEGTRRETANDDTDPEHGVGLKVTARW